MIETKTEEGFLKIPTDFKSLHDLKDLVNNYDLVSRLSNLLNNYQKAHIDSYLMTLDEVLEYIPIRHHDEYKVTIAEYVIDSVYISHGNVKKDLTSKLTYALSEKRYYNGSKSEYEIIPVKEHKKERIFMVNTIKKEISVIYWYTDAPFYKKPHNRFGKIEYEIDAERILSVKVNFSFTAYQQVGGSSISCLTGYSYFRGGQSVPYTREGYELYQFDTKTNQYLGYVKTKIITPERGWHKERR
jgi:hypothetical protein